MSTSTRREHLIGAPKRQEASTARGQLRLKDAIEWEYRRSVKHLRGWDPFSR